MPAVCFGFFTAVAATWAAAARLTAAETAATTTTCRAAALAAFLSIPSTGAVLVVPLLAPATVLYILILLNV
jgi:hypothetical protein